MRAGRFQELPRGQRRDITQDLDVPFSGTIGTFTNSNDSTGSDSYTGYVNWGGGVWAPATIQPVSSGSNIFDIISTNPSGTPGTYTPSVIITDNTNPMTDPDIIPPDPDAVAAPTGVAYSVSTNCQTVTLTWTNTATNSTSVEIEEWDETQVDYNGNPDTNFQWIQTLSATTTTAVITGLTPGGEYEFMVRAVGVGEASYSSPLDMTLPDAGTGVPPVPTLSVSSGFVFTETDSDTTDSLSYIVQFKETDNTTTGNTSWNIWGANDWDDEDSFPNYINPMVGQSYEFRAIAVNGSLRSAPSAVVSMSDDSLPTPSAAVAGFTAEWDPTYGASSGQIDISYADLPSADYLQDVTFSLVQDGMTYPMDASDYTDTSTNQNVDGVVSFGLAAGAVGVTENGKDFDFSKPFTIEANVEQKDIDVYGHQLPAISPVATQAMPPQPGSTPPDGSPEASTPNAPTNLTGVVQKNDVQLEWDDDSNNETGFKIYRGTTNVFTDSTTHLIGTSNADDPTYTDNPLPAALSAGTTVYYFVVATNVAGDSSPVSVMVSKPPPPIIIGFWGFGLPFSDIGLTPLGDANSELRNDVNAAGNAVGATVNVFPENQEKSALSWLLGQLDTNHDGVYDTGDVQRSIEIAGYSWGGWSAIKLAQDIKNSATFAIKTITLLATVDPVDIVKGNPGPVPNNVQIYWNRYESHGNFTEFGITVNGFNPTSNAGNAGNQYASIDVDPLGHSPDNHGNLINHITIMDDYESGALTSILEDPK